MRKIVWIAWREFSATVATKGFIFGLLFPPILLGVMIVIMPHLLNKKPPKIVGEVAVVDGTGEVAPRLAHYFSPEVMAGRLKRTKVLVNGKMPDPLRRFTKGAGTEEMTRQAMETVMGETPELHVIPLATDADLEAEKELLSREPRKEGGRLAVAVIHADAVAPAPGETGYGSYDLFVRQRLDDRIEREIRQGLREAIIDARVRRRGLDRKEIERLTHVAYGRSVTVTREGERKTNQIFNSVIPVAFMALLMVAVMSGGTQLMTTTIEEKSSRVVEVLLAAVSPMELMAGKIAGQLLAGLLILILYAGIGVVALVSFALLGLVDLWLLVYLFIFYFIAYFTMGSLMAAIGAAVNEMSEAQGLMTPVVLLMVAPMMLWLPLSRDPNSLLAVVTSFLPPFSSWVMLLRMSSNAPPPLWQVWLSIGAGLAGVYASLWVAAKVFRIGLLMHGKPPNFATLIRWVRMA
ncbi:MAG: ABC transporter permease [Acidobacteriota bacterium]